MENEQNNDNLELLNELYKNLRIESYVLPCKRQSLCLKIKVRKWQEIYYGKRKKIIEK